MGCICSKPKSSDQNHLIVNDATTSYLISSSDQEQQEKKMIITTLINGERGSLVVAGWPSWLTAVAAEAIAGWIPRTPDSFHKLNRAGISHFLIPFFYNIINIPFHC
jgi:hypothetical protein